MHEKLRLAISVLGPFLESLEQPVAIIDTDGNFVYYNQYDAEIDESSIEENIGKHVLDAYPKLKEETSSMLRALRYGESFIDQHQLYHTRSGRVVDYIHTTLPLYDDEQQIIGAIEIGRDIGNLKNLTNQVLDLSAKLYSHASEEVEEIDSTEIITRNETMKRIIRELDIYADTNFPILVYGETGTGKELFVRRAHKKSQRSDNAFITLNCAAIPDTLLEGILFGTQRGAFTGAENRKGLFELAHKGTLFLDELNSMPLNTQAKLLRVLQDGEVLRLGSNNPVTVDVRVMAAMNESPELAVERGHLREDLFYRLSVGLVKIPPLRFRKDDIVLLALHFLKKYAQDLGRKTLMIHPRVMKEMEQYDWPGNVRMLENVIRRSLMLEDPDHQALNELHIQFTDSPFQVQKESVEEEQPSYQTTDLPLSELVSRYEKDIITRALQQSKGNIKQAAIKLAIPRTTLQYKIQKYGLSE